MRDDIKLMIECIATSHYDSSYDYELDVAEVMEAIDKVIMRKEQDATERG